MKKLKGDPTDLMLLLIILFFLAISLVVSIYTNDIILEQVIKGTVLNESAAYNTIYSSFYNLNNFGVQRAFTMFFGLLIVGILVSSFLIRVHPVFIFIYIFTLGMAIFVSIYLANTYEMVVANGMLAELASSYQTITWVMQHIATILLATGALSMIIIFGKIGGSNNNDVL